MSARKLHEKGKCAICSGRADETFKRVEVWSNARWRLTTSRFKVVSGLCYLEPRRHIPYVTDLDGMEAREFGPVLSKAAKALKSATNARLVYVYVYGGHIPHLHVHLAPHKQGDIFVDDVVREHFPLSRGLMTLDETAALSREIRKGLG